MKLNFEMIPQNMWYCNLRHLLQKKDWDLIRKDAYKKANGKCMICNRVSKRLEAHELWVFNEDTKTQKLDTVIAICSMCHKTIHIGHSELIGKGPDCFKHYCKINKCTIEECIKNYKIAIDTWQKRNLINWKLDLSWLDNYKIKINP